MFIQCGSNEIINSAVVEKRYTTLITESWKLTNVHVHDVHIFMAKHVFFFFSWKDIRCYVNVSSHNNNTNRLLPVLVLDPGYALVVYSVHSLCQPVMQRTVFYSCVVLAWGRGQQNNIVFFL